MYFNYRSKVKPGKGSILISEPYLPDPNFERTVILLCDHNEEGSFGFVLNKPSNLYVADIIEDVDEFKATVYVGGPVQQDTLHYIYKGDNILEGSEEIAKGLYWGGNFEQLMALINNRTLNKEDFRFFVGYSGWGSNQLDEEIEQNSWIISKGLAPNLLFDTKSEDLWKVVLKNMGGRYEMISKYPSDPRLN